MFNLHDFVMNTLKGMVGHEPDYKVRQYALGWYDKAQLTAEDMAAVEAAIDAQYVQPEEIKEEEEK
jgi:hypothetical protein